MSMNGCSGEIVGERHRCDRSSSNDLAGDGHLLVTACGQIPVAAHTIAGLISIGHAAGL
jgi:hypothetical protein